MPTLNAHGAILFYADDDFSDPWRPRTPVLLQHGFGRNANFWRGWVPYFARTRRVVRPDIRGCGRSTLQDGQSFTREVLLGDLVTLLDALEIERVHFIGESIGGMLGIALASLHPRRVRSLTLIATPFTAGGNPSPGQTLGHASWEAALAALGTREWWLRSRAMGGEHATDPREEEYFADEFGRTSIEGALGLVTFLAKEDVSTLARAIVVPTLILAPKQAGNRSSPEQQRSMAALIPGAKREEYEGGRGVFYQRPDDMARKVAAWVDAREEES